MTLAHSDERPHPAVLAALDAVGLRDVPLAIDARDEMLSHLLRAHRGAIGAALVGYFQTGWMAAGLLRRVLGWRFGERGRSRLLDFAGGYGRVSRYFRPGAEPVHITVADVDPEAVEFQRRRFGFEGFVSTSDPDDLEIETRFDAVFVASLFSHLPERRFAAWLHRLQRLLAPGGVLVLSTHGPDAMLPGRTMPAGGLYFETVSESRRLSGDEYGSTWVSEEFMAQAITEASGGGASWRRFPRALWHSQDLWVVVPEPAADLSALDLRPGPRGYLDSCYLGAPERLVISGWAAEPGDGEVEVTVTVDGAPPATVKPSRPRPDARPEIGSAAERAGWELRIDNPEPFALTDLIVVTAASPRGRHVVHAGRLETAGLYLDLLRTAREADRLRDERERAVAELRGVRTALAVESRRVAELDAAVHRLGWEKHLLEQRLEAIERSRFWRLRRAWFRFTGRGEEG